MRKAGVVGAAMALLAVVACTYDVPNVNVPDAKTGGKDGGSGAEVGTPVEASADHTDGPSVTHDAADSSNGQPDTGGMVDASCTGVLCHCANPGDCSASAPLCAQSIMIGSAVYAAAGGSD